MDREKFRKLCHNIVTNWVDDDIDRVIDKVWDTGAKALSLEDEPDNYMAVYPFMGAFFERCADSAIYGGSSRNVGRQLKRKANQIKVFM